MSWFIYFILGCVISSIAGFYYGKKLLNDAEKVCKNTFVESDTDSTVQAQILSKAIMERADILGSSDLSWNFNDGKKNYTFYAFDEIITDYGKHTMYFRFGTSIKLIKFIRLCHSYGCSIMLRQIGKKVEIPNNQGNNIYISEPDIKLFIKEN